MRIVLDTNVLFAAFTCEGFCAKIVRACIAHHELIHCEHILAELRTHLITKGKLESPRVDEVIQWLRINTKIVEPAELPTTLCRDPDDVPVLGAAVASQSSVLVTGDKDLLEIKHFQSILILSPRDFAGRFLPAV